MTTEGIGPTIKAIIKDTGTIAAKPLKSAAKESLGFVAKLREGTRLGKLGNRIGTIAENLERELEPSPQTHLKEHIHKLTEQLSRALSSKFNMALITLKIKQPKTSQTMEETKETPVLEKRKVHFATTEAESKKRFEQFSEDYAENFPPNLDTLSLAKTFVELEKEPKLETRLDKMKTWMNEKNIEQSDQTNLYIALEMFWKTDPPTVPQAKEAPSAPKPEAKKAPQPPSTPSPRRVARQAASESSHVVAAPTSEARKKAILAAMKPTQAAREANREASAFYKNTWIGADLFKAVEDRALSREEADLIRQIYVTESARNQSDEAKAAAIKKTIGERIKTEEDSEKEHALNELISNMDSYIEHPDLMPPPSNQT